MGQTGQLVNFTIPEQGANPSTLAMDSLGRIWIGDERSPGTIWRFTPSNQTWQPFRTSLPMVPVGVLVDTKNNVWFTETNESRLGEITSNTIQEFPLPASNSGPALMTLQNNTSYLWITETFASKITRFDMNSDTFQEFTPSVPLQYPVGIVSDKNGNIWISEHGGSSVVEFTPSSSAFKKFPTSQAPDIGVTGPATIAIDRLGRLWFVEHYANRVGRLDPQTGVMEEFYLPTPGAYSLLNAIDSNGDFWFTESNANRVGMIPHNATSQVSIANTSAPSGPITAGQSGTAQFSIFGTSTTPVNVTIGGTSSFSSNGVTTGSEVSLSTGSLVLGPGQITSVTAKITPDFSLPSGTYAIGVVATYGNTSSSSIIFVNVQGSILYLLSTLIPEILIAVGAGMAVYLFWRRRTHTGLSRSTPKASIVATLTLLGAILFAQTITIVNAKCPGFPQPTPNPNGTPSTDYYGIILDVGSITFFAIVAYYLIREHLRKRGS